MKKHTADNQNVNPAEEKDSEKLENSAARESGDNVTENGETASDTLSDGAEHSEEPADKEEAKTPAKDFEKEAAEWEAKYQKFLEADPERAAQYAELFRTYREIHDALAPVYRKRGTASRAR